MTRLSSAAKRWMANWVPAHFSVYGLPALYFLIFVHFHRARLYFGNSNFCFFGYGVDGRVAVNDRGEYFSVVSTVKESGNRSIESHDGSNGSECGPGFVLPSPKQNPSNSVCYALHEVLQRRVALILSTRLLRAVRRLRFATLHSLLHPLGNQLAAVTP